MRTRYPYLQRRAEVLKELENIKFDFCPDYQDDARVEDELQNYVDNNKMKEMHNISAQRRFRYFDRQTWSNLGCYSILNKSRGSQGCIWPLPYRGRCGKLSFSPRRNIGKSRETFGF